MYTEEKEEEGANEKCYVVRFDVEEFGNTDNTLSVHALIGSHRVGTIRMLGLYINRKMVILIDSGSTTNSFVEKITTELKLELVLIFHIVV